MDLRRNPSSGMGTLWSIGYNGCFRDLALQRWLKRYINRVANRELYAVLEASKKGFAVARFSPSIQLLQEHFATTSGSVMSIDFPDSRSVIRSMGNRTPISRVETAASPKATIRAYML